MKIKMIGTGAISVKQRSACSLINNKILIDCGNGTVKTLLEQNVDIKEINTLLITRLYGNHFLDIPFLIMQRKFCSACNELNIFCPKGTEEINIIDTLDKRERWVANYIINNKKIKSKDIANHFKINNDTANNWIKK